jgi:hypothetical protein
MASDRILIVLLLLFTGSIAEAQSIDSPEVARHRIRLADRFAILVNDIPEALRADSVGRMQAVRNNGYRIQILNTRDVREAEAYRIAFEEWAASEFPANSIFSYVLYKQPFYRVHVGDFRGRNKAQELANRVKERFPDAWVVVDQVVPERVR